MNARPAGVAGELLRWAAVVRTTVGFTVWVKAAGGSDTQVHDEEDHMRDNDPTSMNPAHTDIIAALAAENASTRLSVALMIGSNAESGHVLVDALIARCATEPDFYVRDMLTWALTRFPSETTVPKLLAELSSDGAQARSQALHTLSKIKDRNAFPAITPSLLRDSDDDVARSAWRAAVVLVPEDKKRELAEELSEQFGRGDREVQFSLSRALVALGADLIEPVLQKAMASDAQRVRAHARATERLLRDPNAGFELAIHEAKRQYLLKDRPA